MSRKAELIALVLSDFVAFSVSSLLLFMARFRWEWFGPDQMEPPWMLWPVLALSIFWLCLFLFFGMYRERYAASRFDEVVSVGKVATVGILVLVFAIFIDTLEPGGSRIIILCYWAFVLLLVSLGRLVVRSVQKAFILRGRGLHRALVVGWTERVERLYEEVARYPEAGLQIVGAVRMRREDGGGEAVTYSVANGDAALARVADEEDVHTIEALPTLIDKLRVQDVLIALGSEDHASLIEVLRLCDGKAVSLKIVPDFYMHLGGMVRTEHMYGLPLIEVLPEPMPSWEKSTKRLIDMVVALLVLVLGIPLWLVLGILVRATSPGPAIYRQTRVGQHNKPFVMYKFRTMHQNAEAGSGPVWAKVDDPRHTPMGRWLRKARLDEIPQFWNVLKGEMSLVGPRPERPHFVEKLTGLIALYGRRHRVKPGITGWAQVNWKYDTNLEGVWQKVKFDLFYIENANLRMDFKILFRTIRTILSGKGQ